MGSNCFCLWKYFSYFRSKGGQGPQPLGRNHRSTLRIGQCTELLEAPGWAIDGTHAIGRTTIDFILIFDCQIELSGIQHIRRWRRIHDSGKNLKCLIWRCLCPGPKPVADLIDALWDWATSLPALSESLLNIPSPTDGTWCTDSTPNKNSRFLEGLVFLFIRLH